MYVCMHVYMCMHDHRYVYVCMHVYMCMYDHMILGTTMGFAYMYVCMNYVCACMST